MDTNKEDKPKRKAGQTQVESTFTESSTERQQDFSNEQEQSTNEKKIQKDSQDETLGNLSDQYHSATKTGEIQNKNNKASEKSAHQGNGYYDRGPHQPSLAESDKKDKDKSDED